MDETSTDLKSWVRTLNHVEGMALLDVARPQMTLDTWRREAQTVLTQEEAAYRSLLVKLVERILLDHDGETIKDSVYLDLFQNGWEQLRKELFFARYGLAHQWTILAAHEVLAPAVAQASGDEILIEVANWDAFVDRHIDPSVGESSRRKTRSSIIGLFRNMGCLTTPGGGRGPMQINRTHPSPLVYGWILAEQLNAYPDRIFAKDWLVEHSNATALFNPFPAYARRCIDAALRSRLIRRTPRGLGIQSAA